MHQMGGASATTDSGGGALCRPRRARPPGAPCLSRVQHRAGGRHLRAVGAGGVDGGPGRQGAPARGDAGRPTEAMGGADAVRGGPRSGARAGGEAGGETGGRAPVGGPEAAGHRGAAGAWRGCAGGPVAEDVAQALAGRDAWRPGAPGGAVGVAGGARVPGWAAECALACRRGGGIVGPARGKRGAGLGPGARLDRTEPAAILVAPRGHEGPCLACQAHREGVAVAWRAAGRPPGVQRFRPLFQAQQRTGCRASGGAAVIGCRLRPVAAHKGRTDCGDWWRQGAFRRLWDRGAKGQAGGRAATA